MFTCPHDAEELALMRDTWVFGHALEHGACEQNILAFEQLEIFVSQPLLYLSLIHI